MGKSIIIIGAGLAGLSTGCYAQMNGYHTHIFEHHTTPGGVATAWKRKGYIIDGGIHFLMGHKPGQPTYEMYRELGTAQTNRFLDLPIYGRFIDETSRHSIEITPDLDRMANELKTFSPADVQTIDNLIAGARTMKDFAMGQIGMDKPPELMGPLDQLKDIWKMRRIFKYFTGRYAKPVDDYVQTMNDPWLREVIRNLFLPEAPVWFILMLLGMLADRQMGLLEGGVLSFVLPIEKRYKDLGGQITYKATVEEILVKNGRAIGIRLADGSKHHADIVVSAADGYSTIFKMLGGRFINKRIESRYRNWKLMRPFVMASFGIAREFAGEPWLNMLMLKHPFIAGNQTINGLMVRIFNYSDKFAPKGKTVVQVTFETEWEWWNELHNDQPRYHAEKERLAKEVLQRLETHYPGISSLVEITDVATPYTTWRYTRNYNGAYEGWMPTPEAIMTQIERTLPGLANFYIAGQWVMPGGGVPPCLYSGRHVVQMLCRKDKKSFSTSLP